MPHLPPNFPPILRTVLLLLAALTATPGQAYIGQATDDAFAAVLAMPGAEPQDGHWNIPAPNDFEPKNETRLVAYLARKKKAGADFNAYRHFGTLLHHAIRARKSKTALWLLENGADPRKTAHGDNALILSQRYQLNRVTEVLVAKFDLQAEATLSPPHRQVRAVELDPRQLTPADHNKVRRMLSEAVMAANTLAANPDRAKRLQATIDFWENFRKGLPPAAYPDLLDDDQALRDLLQIYIHSPGDLDKVLADIPTEVLARRANAAVGGIAAVAIARYREDKGGAIEYSIPAESWRVLWQRLPVPIDYAGHPALAEGVQPDLWGELFASGYANRHSESALGCMLSNLSAGDLAALWPRIESSFPDIRQSAPQMVLAHYRMVSGKPNCWSWNSHETKDKLRFLTSRGIQGQVKGVVKREIDNQSTGLLAAMKPFVERRPAATSAPRTRLLDAQPRCHFALTDPWYQELVKAPMVAVGDFGVHVETVQMVEIPGESECALLVGGFQRINEYRGGPHDRFTGPVNYPTPSCPDPTDRYEVWQNQGGRIERLATDMGQDDGRPQLSLVEDTVTGERYYLHSGAQMGGCYGRRRLPFAFQWQRVNGAWALKRFLSPEIEDALFDQCNALDYDEVRCAGIAATSTRANDSADVAPPLVPTTAYVYARKAFMKLLRSSMFDDYQRAIMEMNKPLLKRLQADGIPGEWTAEAIRRVSASPLPLPEKRKRTAWLFYDHARLARVLDLDLLQLLLSWLPREDWAPIFEVIAADPGNYYGLDDLRSDAEKQGLTQLACDIDHAQGLICGETWGSEPAD